MPNFGKMLKGLGNKPALKGLSDAVHDQQLSEDVRQLKQYEQQSKLADAQRQHLKRLQMEEAANTKINHLKVMNNWRKFMRSNKLENLKKDLEILAQDHEREVDRKDAIVNLLIRNLDEAEEQMQVAQRSHMAQVDKLTELHESRLTLIESEFEAELLSTRNEYDSEIKHLQTQHIREKKELQNIINTVEAEEREREAEAKQEHETEREDIRTKNVDDINMLRLTLESVIDDLEKQFDEAHAQYMENTEKKTKDFKVLTEQDKEYSEDIDRKLRQIERLQSLLTYWRKKIAQNEREGKERNRLLKAEKEAVLKHYHELKDRMSRSRDQQAKRLTDLTLWARDASKVNEERLERAERILKLNELSRKLESVHERVQPFLASQLDLDLYSSEAPTFELTAELKDKLLQEQSNMPAEWTELDRFYRKYNRALLGKLAIEQEKSRLEKENQDLRSILKQYLDGITVTSEVVDGPNPLLVVNGRVNLNQRPVRRAGSKNPTVVEANTVVHIYASHNS